MKKIIISLMLISAFILTGCQNKEKTDAVKFKEEYERLNNQVVNDKKYLELTIDKKNPIKYKTAEEIVDIIKNKTGIIYLGYPECPWCRNAIPVLLEAAKQTGVNDIYYLNMHDIRDKKELKDGKVVTVEEGTEGYKKILEALGDKASVYKDLNDESIKRIYVPLVIFVENGKVVATQESTVESQKDPYVKLTEEQEKELLNIYKDNIHKVYNDMCDESC